MKTTTKNSLLAVFVFVLVQIVSRLIIWVDSKNHRLQSSSECTNACRVPNS